jgi:hypothetical protein
MWMEILLKNTTQYPGWIQPHDPYAPKRRRTTITLLGHSFGYYVGFITVFFDGMQAIEKLPDFSR